MGIAVVDYFDAEVPLSCISSGNVNKKALKWAWGKTTYWHSGTGYAGNQQDEHKSCDVFVHGGQSKEKAVG